MTSIAGLITGAAVAALAGGLSLAAATYERHMAEAQQHVAVGDFEEAVATLAEARRYADYAAWLPWIGNAPLHDLQAREAAVHYWQGAYPRLVPEQGDAVSAVDADNVELQFVVANAAFRALQPRMRDRAGAVQALDEAMNGYLNVLKHPVWKEDAAYNYEYVARLRDDIARGRRQAPQTGDQPSDPLGQAGSPAVPAGRQQFEIYIPLESDERPETGEAGKAGARPRRG